MRPSNALCLVTSRSCAYFQAGATVTHVNGAAWGGASGINLEKSEGEL
jgi:hypothetical protein